MLTLAGMWRIRLTTRRTDDAGFERASFSLMPASPGFWCGLWGASSPPSQARPAFSLAWDGDARCRPRQIFGLSSHIPILWPSVWLSVWEPSPAADSIVRNLQPSGLLLLVPGLDIPAYISEAGTDTEGRAVGAGKVHVGHVGLT
jgi:hypothetical protein